MAEKKLVATLEEDALLEEKEPFLVINKDTVKRPGVILRLAAMVTCFVAIILTVVLPTVTIDYKNYSNSTTFDKLRAAAFPSEIISGPNALFGGGYYGMYLRSKDTAAHILVTNQAHFNWVLTILLVVLLASIVLAFFVTFSKKAEKLSKLVVLVFCVGGFVSIASPIWFMVTNNIGNNYAVQATELANYWLYDSFYCHCAWGAIAAAVVFLIAGVLFGLGATLENKGGERGQ